MITKLHDTSVDLLKISNLQSEGCGKPPSLTLEMGQFVSYFENHYGEQWMMVAEKDKQSAVLYGGDIGWKSPVKLQAPFWLDKVDIVLNREELYWILSCLLSIEKDMAIKDSLLNIIQVTTSGKSLPIPSFISKAARLKESQVSDKEVLKQLKGVGLVFAPE